MKKIELEQWEPFPGDPRRMQYAGQRVAQEVFEELKHRLEGMGYLPDEYFLMDREWENGREIPKDADIFCTTDYGGNEGVYLDVYLKWYEDSRPVTKSFITGKTLGETGADLDRMFLISSAITKAFHGDGETYARHLRQGERAEPEGMIVHLNPTEQRTIIEALVEQQERQEQAMSQTEQLLPPIWMRWDGTPCTSATTIKPCWPFGTENLTPSKTFIPGYQTRRMTC